MNLGRELRGSPGEVARGVHPERPARALVELLLALAKILCGLALGLECWTFRFEGC